MIIADASSLISMAMNCLSKVFPKMGVKVYVTPGVRDEVITRPMNIKRFALEAYRIKTLFDGGIIEVYKPDAKMVDGLTSTANNIYRINGKPLKIIHKGEAEALALVEQHNADALLIDERTTRLLLEDPHELKSLLAHRTKKSVDLNENTLKQFRERMPNVPVIRSSEVAFIAFERGLIDELDGEDRGHSLESLLSALKFNGCAINWGEIKEYKRLAGS